jgi:hypothetical protein
MITHEDIANLRLDLASLQKTVQRAFSDSQRKLDAEKAWAQHCFEQWEYALHGTELDEAAERAAWEKGRKQ